jgi:hypothetical protein
VGAVGVGYGRTGAAGRGGGATGAGGCGGLARGLGSRFEKLSGAFEIVAAGRAQKAVVADLGEAAREDVLEEPCDELLGRQRQAPGLAGAAVGVAEGDAAVFEALDTVVGQGDTIDVAREVEGGLFAGADLLDVDPPVALGNPFERHERLGISASRRA